MFTLARPDSVKPGVQLLTRVPLLGYFSFFFLPLALFDRHRDKFDARNLRTQSLKRTRYNNLYRNTKCRARTQPNHEGTRHSYFFFKCIAYYVSSYSIAGCIHFSDFFHSVIIFVSVFFFFFFCNEIREVVCICKGVTKRFIDLECGER